jgi:lipopolysaccharide/colanic/teichoic acid biosynthesis glycosyltransferase
MLVAWLLLESKGPVFYVAKRAGRGYKIFNFKIQNHGGGADSKITDYSHLNQYNSTSTWVLSFQKSKMIRGSQRLVPSFVRPALECRN